jgi:hypothetical protein
MDSRNFYYLQRVLESDLDEVEADVAAALKHARVDLGVFGVHSGGTVTQNAPPDLHVLVTGPALATDPDGERVAWATTQTVDCSQDHLGNSTTVVGGGNERWLSVIAEFDQTYADLVTDGNGTPVYTRVYDSYAIYVTMEAEAVIPTAARPALPTDGVLLADVYLANGTVQILNADIYTNRRQDYVRVAGTTIPDFVYGTPQTAIAALAAYVDGLSVGTGVGFTATQNWADATTIAATDVSAAINEVISDLAATAGAARIGLAAHATAGHFCDVAVGTPQSAINGIADAVDGHIGGGAPAHADTTVTSAAIAGDPGFTGGSVRDALTDLFDEITARYKWRYDATPGTADEYNPAYLNVALRAKTLYGGTVPAIMPLCDVAAGLWGEAANSAAHPWDADNEVSLGDYQIWDLCVCFTTNGDRRIVALANKPTPATGDAAYALVFDPESASVTTLNLTNNSDLLPYGSGEIWGGVSICSDGTYFYTVFEDASGNHRVQGYDLAGARRSSMTASGISLPGTGVSPWSSSDLQFTCYGRIIVAAMTGGASSVASKLATANWWEDLGSGSYPISVVNLSGNTVSSGRGDSASLVTCTPANCYPIGGLCTDGTNLFATFAEASTGGGGVITALIATPSSGSGLPSIPIDSADFICQGILCDGSNVYMAVNQAAATVLSIYRLSPATGAELATSFSVTATAYDKLRFLGFDGVNLHVQMHDDIADDGSSAFALVTSLLRVSGIPNLSGSYTFSNYSKRTVHWCQQSEVAAFSSHAYDAGPLAFDGDAFWQIMHVRSGDGTWSGVLRRLPRAGLL